ncbi:hypothetical protein DFI02_10251 [Rhizobium sp. PP-F2F-G20b]|nr:hypothetical protein DFI02_10251 [Rhizobium sp. PP-F2F-G20b]
MAISGLPKTKNHLRFDPCGRMRLQAREKTHWRKVLKTHFRPAIRFP